MIVETRTILLVEDDESHREGMGSLFERAGYRVLAAGDAASGLAQLESESLPPAVIVLDWMLPAAGGLEFLSGLIADPRATGVPVIVLSEVATTSRIPTRNVTAVLSKPVRARTLLDVAGRLSGAIEMPPRLEHARRRGRVTPVLRRKADSPFETPTTRVRVKP